MTRTKMPLDMRSRFGFHCMPFTRELPVEQRLVLPFHEEALTALRRAVEARMSCLLLAPSGSGKTVTLRALAASLPEARFGVHYVKVTDLSRRDMCREIAVAAGAEPAGSYPMLVRRLQERFEASANTEGRRPVLVLDDAHAFRPDVLGLVRVLTNFEMDSRLVVSIVLAGQPPLRKMLEREELEDVARRLAHCATLRLLSRDETRTYVEHRCTIAGAKTVPFDGGALETLYEIGRGNLRATDALARKALEVTADAELDVVGSAHVLEAKKRVVQ